MSDEPKDQVITEDGRTLYLLRGPYGAPIMYVSQEIADELKAGIIRPKFPRIIGGG